jgi:hypothetical protein
MRLRSAVFLLFLVLATVMPAAAQTTFTVTANGSVAYVINMQSNPTLNLVRGQTYTFNVNASGHPFWIKSVQSIGTSNAFNTGVTNNGDDVGTVTWTVPGSAPATLFYNCEFHGTMTGEFHITGSVPVEPDTWGRLKARYRRPA